jgi:RNA polymerase sigma factor (sigma-70 family)
VIIHEDADDILQNTFIKVFKNIHKFKGDNKLFTWIYRIASNEFLAFLNKNAKQNNISFSRQNRVLKKNY